MAFSLSVEAANYDVAVEDLVVERVNYVIGESPNIAYKVTNNGSESVETITVDYKVNGAVVKSVDVSQRIVPGRTVTISDTLPVELTTPQKNVELGITITHVNGQPNNNTTENSASESVNIYKYLYDRNVVIEEGTGTWCGWCVRGIVAMEKMKEEHPDDFIGIAVHNNDKMETPAYSQALNFTSYPACNLNRSEKQLSVDTLSLEAYYQYGKIQRALGQIEITSTRYDADETLGVSISSEFCYTGTDRYNIALVLVEDSITGYLQNNYFSGGGYGTLRGFENMPKTVSVPFYDVARGIYPSYEGETFVESVEDGKTYTFSHTITLPVGIQHKSKLSLVALLIDSDTGVIVNAAKKQLGLRDDETPTGDGEDDEEQQISDYRCVDMGLSVLWSDANMLGDEDNFAQASSEEVCGGYFGWADPTGLLTDTDDNLYPSGTVPSEISGTILDIARCKWGAPWRLPTHEEFVELYNNCNVTPETVNGIAGCRFTSVINGNSIFFPYNGDRYDTDVWGVGDYGSYWSGTLCPEQMDGIYYVYQLDFDDYGVNINNVSFRSDGMGVRPVYTRTTDNDTQLHETSAEIESVEYFSPSGIAVSRNTRGLIIQKTRYSNGSIVTKKILNKK